MNCPSTTLWLEEGNGVTLDKEPIDTAKSVLKSVKKLEKDKSIKHHKKSKKFMKKARKHLQKAINLLAMNNSVDGDVEINGGDCRSSQGQEKKSKVNKLIKELEGDFPVGATPDVTIDQPQLARSFLLGSEVRFSATVSDPDGDIIGNNMIVWSSNRDGEIGRGTQLSTMTLSQGLHSISVSAEDGKGNRGTDTVSIALSPQILPKFENLVLGKIRNARTKQLIESTDAHDVVHIELKAEGNNAVYDSLGLEIIDQQLISDGRLVFQTAQVNYPFTIKVIAHAEGYLSSSRIIALKQSGKVDFELLLNEQDNPVEGASVKTDRSGVVNNSGVLQRDITVNTASNANFPGSVKLTLAKDTRITDENNQPLSGGLVVQATYFSSLSTETLQTFPGGLVFDRTTVESVTDIDWQAACGDRTGLVYFRWFCGDKYRRRKRP